MVRIFRLMLVLLYRVIKKSLCTLWLQNRKLQVMFKVSPAILQTFIDTPNCVLEDRVQYITLHIPNVFCDGHLQLISCVGIVLYYTVIVRCTETFWSPCIYIYIYSFIHSFIHLVVCLTTGPKPLPTRAVHIVRSRASSFILAFLKVIQWLPTSSSSSSCHIYPPFYLPSITFNISFDASLVLYI